MLPRSFAVLLLFSTLSAPAQNPIQSPVQTVPSVDLHLYAGKWYEIARIPNRYQAKCASSVIAEYVLQGEDILVNNTCTQKSGAATISHAKAKVVDSSTDAKWKVVFFWPFSADYWIIGLDPQYRWAIVGQPDREYLWILSRTPTLPRPILDTILHQIDAAGYHSNSLLFTAQSLSP